VVFLSGSVNTGFDRPTNRGGCLDLSKNDVSPSLKKLNTVVNLKNLVKNFSLEII
jgi:hypothetical protein